MAELNPSMPETRIALSKGKIVLLTLLGCGFVALGVWMVSMDAQTIAAQRRFNMPWLVYGIGLLAIVFFGFCTLIGIKKLVDSKPGLILGKSGFADNSSGVSSGFVPWSAVLDIREEAIHGQRFVLVMVHNPEDFIAPDTGLKRMAQLANLKMCGTPVSLSANGLKVSHAELLALLKAYHAKSQVGFR